MGKTACIITGGTRSEQFILNYIQKHQNQTLVVVDGALETTHRLGLLPDAIVGDFDTVDQSLLAYYDNRIIFRHPPEKDQTDTELAIETAQSMGCTRFVFLGATGSRLDHSLANVFLLQSLLERGIEAEILNETNRLYLKKEDFSIKKQEQYGEFVSLLALTETVQGVTLRGFKYPLTYHTVYRGSTLCISNEITEETARVELTDGTLIVVEARDEDKNPEAKDVGKASKTKYADAAFKAKNADKTPTTITELQQWVMEHNIPTDAMNTFIGVDYRGPRAFGIYRDSYTGNFVVYKNKADGTRAVRYDGSDEAYAVNELYMKMKERLTTQLKKRGNRQRTSEYAQPYPYPQTDISNKKTRKKSKAVWKILGIIVGIQILPWLLTKVSLLIFTAYVAIVGAGRPEQGYYEINESDYYYSGSRWYVWEDVAWDIYESDYDLSEYEYLEDAYLGSYYDDIYGTDYGFGNFEDSEYYYSYFYSTDDNDDDWYDDSWDDDDDWDDDWDWDDSWDDWDSDW